MAVVRRFSLAFSFFGSSQRRAGDTTHTRLQIEHGTLHNANDWKPTTTRSLEFVSDEVYLDNRNSSILSDRSSGRELRWALFFCSHLAFPHIRACCDLGGNQERNFAWQKWSPCCFLTFYCRSYMETLFVWVRWVHLAAAFVITAIQSSLIHKVWLELPRGEVSFCWMVGPTANCGEFWFWGSHSGSHDICCLVGCDVV